MLTSSLLFKYIIKKINIYLQEDLRRMDSLQERFGVHLGQVPGTSSSDSTSSVSLRLNQSLAKAVIKLGARVTALESKVRQHTKTAKQNNSFIYKLFTSTLIHF